MREIEYLVFKLTDITKEQEVLNAMGTDGWQLIAVRNQGDAVIHYLSRPKV